jgi:hypothetical protein
MAGYCVHGNESSGSVKRGKIFLPTQQILLSQEGIFFVDFY